MLKLTLRGLLKNKIRFLLTSLAVVLGVTFVVAAFVVTDGLRSTFEGVSQDIYSTQDFSVRGTGPDDFSRSPVPEELVGQIEAIPGVTNVSGYVEADQTYPIDDDGETAEPFGPPRFGISWSGNPIDNYLLLEGEGPDEPDEFALDQNFFDDFNFTIGNTYVVVSEAGGPQEFTLTGTFRFGIEDEVSVGPVFAAFEPETAQRFLGLPDQYQEIAIAIDPSANADDVQSQIRALLPADAVVITGEEAAEEFVDGFTGFFTAFRAILLTFAFVVLFVSAFLINNTFTIIIGQRVRELGLLRAIGATGRQVRQSVMIEALAVGLISTVLGTILGLGAARVLIAILESFGASFPDGPLPLEPRTIIWALVVGVLVTMISAYLPARKAATVSPMEALSETGGLEEARNGRRSIIGGLVAIAGIAGTLFGLFGSFDEATPRLIVLGLGAVLSFIAVAILSPLLVKPVVAVVGAPIAAFGKRAGKLASSNASRSPQRTAGTAVALTIGLALVSTVTIIGASLKSTVSDALSNTVTADYIVTAFGQLPEGVLEEVSALPEIGDITTFTGEDALVAGEDRYVEGLDFSTISSLIDADLTEGTYDSSGGNTVLFRDYADELGVGVGDTVNIEFPNGVKEDFTVSGIFDDNTFFDSISIDVADHQRFFESNEVGALIASGADGVSPADARAALDESLELYPQLNVQDQAEFLEETESQIDQLLAIINVFLGLSVLIALIGIVNTLTLSVFERTRELGLLRAVGMTRRQIRRMVRWESVIVAVFGAVLGIGLGVLFGWAISDAIPDDIVAKATFPIGQLFVFVVAAVLVGLIAAILPARRAAKLNILEAISS